MAVLGEEWNPGIIHQHDIECAGLALPGICRLLEDVVVGRLDDFHFRALQLRIIRCSGSQAIALASRRDEHGDVGPCRLDCGKRPQRNRHGEKLSANHRFLHSVQTWALFAAARAANPPITKQRRSLF
jgi:hypothetical protein